MDKNKILTLLADVLEKPPEDLKSLSANTPLTEIGLDSIRFIQFVVALEEAFEIEILDSDLLLSNFSTSETLWATLEKYFSKPEAMKKVLVLDCDNLLWEGIAGEEEIFLTKAHSAFQEQLIAFYEKGVLLCLCSKNEQKNVETAFENLSMPLQISHIAAMQVNLSDKTENLQKLSVELNLSLDSFVFVDDSDYEVGLVETLLPEVTAIKADYETLSFMNQIQELFSETAPQDLNRTKLYLEQKQREKEKRRFSTVEEYNASLHTEVCCALLAPEQIERFSELSRRTNQFNLSGKRYQPKDLHAFMENCAYDIFTIIAKDCYGDMGIVGGAVVKQEEKSAIIESFFLSCRVFGRGFEDILLETMKEQYSDFSLAGIFVNTEKNYRYQNFFNDHGVEQHE